VKERRERERARERERERERESDMCVCVCMIYIHVVLYEERECVCQGAHFVLKCQKRNDPQVASQIYRMMRKRGKKSRRRKRKD
jgi:hypothetical protein